jgi:hypothetical protein
LNRLRDLVSQLAASAHLTHKTPTPRTSAPSQPVRAQSVTSPKPVATASRHEVSRPTSAASVSGTGPGNLPRADAAIPSLTLTVDDMASKRLDKFVKKELSKPVEKKSQSSVLDSLTFMMPADPQQLWQGLGGVGTAIPAKDNETELVSKNKIDHMV